jgi:hypothetical protein
MSPYIVADLLLIYLALDRPYPYSMRSTGLCARHRTFIVAAFPCV